MKGGEICAGGDVLSGYNAGDCASNRCIDWIGADTQCSRVCYSMLNGEPCETRSPSTWVRARRLLARRRGGSRHGLCRPRERL